MTPRTAQNWIVTLCNGNALKNHILYQPPGKQPEYTLATAQQLPGNQQQ